jgi:DNA end-binding protein Ku
MPARPMGRVSLTLGLLTAPVSIMKATETGRVFELHQYSPAGNRIRYRRVDEVTGEEIANEEIRRGTEVDGVPVILDEADQAALDTMVTASKEWAIECFVPATAVSPLSLDGDAYHLVPDPKIPGSAKVYAAISGATAGPAGWPSAGSRCAATSGRF